MASSAARGTVAGWCQGGSIPMSRSAGRAPRAETSTRQADGSCWELEGRMSDAAHRRCSMRVGRARVTGSHQLEGRQRGRENLALACARATMLREQCHHSVSIVVHAHRGNVLFADYYSHMRKRPMSMPCRASALARVSRSVLQSEASWVSVPSDDKNETDSVRGGEWNHWAKDAPNDCWVGG